MTHDNGVVTTYSYDAASQLLSLVHQLGATTINSFTYTYDKIGNRKTKADNIQVGTPLRTAREHAVHHQKVRTRPAVDLVPGKHGHQSIPLPSCDEGHSIEPDPLSIISLPLA